ncbi:Uncharacterized protein HZ326_17935 [Fusarium oxysporum f. sp. albedinis]|nr:Uncharacterized protein HZ326_17935 [Fusarium oxysporum f. sp. albedinis]
MAAQLRRGSSRERMTANSKEEEVDGKRERDRQRKKEREKRNRKRKGKGKNPEKVRILVGIPKSRNDYFLCKSFERPELYCSFDEIMLNGLRH